MRTLRSTFLLIGLMALGQGTTQAGYGTATATQATFNGLNTNVGATSLVPQASTSLYSNVTNFEGYGYQNGGASTTSLGDTTKAAYDDITTGTSSAGAAVTSLTFSVTNFNAAAVSADAVISIYTVGSNGLPGTLVSALVFSPISFAGGGTTSTLTYSPSSTIFTVPTSGAFWVGESFTDGSGFGTATGATAAQLNLLGEGLFNPPTVGSSNDYFYASSGSDTQSSNPAGSLLYFGGNPVANFGFAFAGTVVVPEPSSLVLTSLAGVVLTFAASRKKARRLAN